MDPSDVKEQGDNVPVLVSEEQDDKSVGEYIGQCKWFNDKLGYGFVTICNGADKGKDIFVHHSGIMPLNSNYKTLRKGEYIQFDVVEGQNGLQAVAVKGIGGGPLMCDFVTTKFTTQGPPGSPSAPIVMCNPSIVPPSQWNTVSHKKSKFNGKKTRPYVR